MRAERRSAKAVAIGAGLAAAIAASGWLVLARSHAGTHAAPERPASAAAAPRAGAAVLPRPRGVVEGIALAPALGARGASPADPRRALDSAVRGLAAALAAKDFEAVSLAEARLRAFLEGDEARAAALLEIFKQEKDPTVLASIASALASDPGAAASAAIAAAMLGIAEDAGGDKARREQALLFLGEATGAAADVAPRLAALAAASDDPALRQGALGALASLARACPDLRAVAVPALLGALRAEPEAETRASILAGIPLADTAPEAASEVAAMLRNDPSPEVREAAAHALGDAAGPARAPAVDTLEASFAGDPAPDVKRAVLISLVRLLGGGARAPIADLRPVAGDATADVDDYLAILAAGETQAERIFKLKFAREAARGQIAGSTTHDDD